MKVLHIITNLGNGGAEASLIRLVLGDKDNSHLIVSLGKSKYYNDLLIKNNIHTINLNMNKAFPFKALFELYLIIKDNQPDIVQSWMYHADLLGGTVAYLAGFKRIFWGIRNSNLEAKKISRSTNLIAKLSALISSIVPHRIVSCSHVAAKTHISFGYNPSKITVINNGYDLSNLNINPKFKARFKENFQIDTKIVLGMVARWDIQKDHENLLASLNHILDDPTWTCVLVGTGMDHTNKILMNLIQQYHLELRIKLLGPLFNINEVMNGLDMHLLSSSSEGFPNVVAEAMACGVPVITTDAGDASIIAGDFGWVVPIKNPTALSHSIRLALNLIKNEVEWEGIRQKSRNHILENFSIEKMVAFYNIAWRS